MDFGANTRNKIRSEFRIRIFGRAPRSLLHLKTLWRWFTWSAVLHCGHSRVSGQWSAAPTLALPHSCTPALLRFRLPEFILSDLDFHAYCYKNNCSVPVRLPPTAYSPYLHPCLYGDDGSFSPTPVPAPAPTPASSLYASLAMIASSFSGEYSS